MRKLKVLLGLFFILSMALSACGTGATATPTTASSIGSTTAATEAATQPALGATTAPLPGTGLTSTAVVTPTTSAATSVATEAATPVTGMVTSTSGLPATGMIARPDFVSYLLTLHVQGPNGEDLGKVQDLVLNFCTDRIDYVLLAPGPSLGVASGQLIAIPWTALTISGAGVAALNGTSTAVAPSMTETATSTQSAGGLANGAYVLVLNTSLARVQGAPTVAQTGLNVTVQGWDQAILTYWGITPANCAAMTGTATVEPGMMGTETAGTPEAAAGAGAASSMSATATGVAGGGVFADVLATQFLGSAINGSTGNTAGNVQDVEVGIATGQIRYVVLIPDASLNLGTGKVLFVPAAVIRLQTVATTGPVFMVTVGQDVLAKAPTFDQANLPDTSTSNWDATIASYWATYISGTH